MKIVSEPKTIELSYLDLIDALRNDIDTDDLMPQFVKESAMEQLKNLQTIIEPYSA